KHPPGIARGNIIPRRSTGARSMLVVMSGTSHAPGSTGKATGTGVTHEYRDPDIGPGGPRRAGGRETTAPGPIPRGRGPRRSALLLRPRDGRGCDTTRVRCLAPRGQHAGSWSGGLGVDRGPRGPGSAAVVLWRRAAAGPRPGHGIDLGPHPDRRQ